MVPSEGEERRQLRGWGEGRRQRRNEMIHDKVLPVARGDVECADVLAQFCKGAGETGMRLGYVKGKGCDHR